MKKIRIMLKEDKDGGFYIYSPDLRGCISQGDTEVEAVRNFAEALELWLEVQCEIQARGDEGPQAQDTSDTQAVA